MCIYGCAHHANIHMTTIVASKPAAHSHNAIVCVFCHVFAYCRLAAYCLVNVLLQLDATLACSHKVVHKVLGMLGVLLTQNRK